MCVCIYRYLHIDLSVSITHNPTPLLYCLLVSLPARCLCGGLVRLRERVGIPQPLSPPKDTGDGPGRRGPADSYRRTELEQSERPRAGEGPRRLHSDLSAQRWESGTGNPNPQLRPMRPDSAGSRAQVPRLQLEPESRRLPPRQTASCPAPPPQPHRGPTWEESGS